SAARVTVARIASRSRAGMLRIVVYPWRWKIVTPGNEPAFLPPNPGNVSARVQAPDAGAHTAELGSGVFSFAAPVHHRGPFSGPVGSAFALARPNDVSRHVPGTVTVAPADKAKLAVSPALKRAVFGLSASATSGPYAVPELVTSVASTSTGT